MVRLGAVELGNSVSTTTQMKWDPSEKCLKPWTHGGQGILSLLPYHNSTFYTLGGPQPPVFLTSEMMYHLRTPHELTAVPASTALDGFSHTLTFGSLSIISRKLAGMQERTG